MLRRFDRKAPPFPWCASEDDIVKRSEKIVWALATVGLLGGVAFVTVSTVARQRRGAAMARLLARPVTAPQVTDMPAPARDNAGAPAPGQAPTPGATDDVVDQLLEHAKALHGDWALADFLEAWSRRAYEFTEAEWLDGEPLVAKHDALVAETVAAVARDRQRLVSFLREPSDREVFPSDRMATIELLGNLIASHAEMSFRRGEVEAGVTSLTTALDLVNALATPKNFFTSPWNSIHENACAVMNRSLPIPLPQPFIDALLTRLSRLDPQEAAAQAITFRAQWWAENWPAQVEAMRNYQAGHGESWFERPLHRSEQLLDDLLQKPTAEVLYGSSLGGAMVDRDIATFLDVMARTRDAVLIPYLEALPVADAIDREVEALDGPYHLVQMCWIPAVGTIEGLTYRTVNRDLATMGMLVERFHADFNDYPQSLDMIAVDIPGGLPTDPFSGHEYRYRVGNDNFSLYSVGNNQRDDDATGDDIVWRYDYTKRSSSPDAPG